MKRVVVLGAGFSIPAGLPSAYGLTELILSKAKADGSDRMNHWIDGLKSRILATGDNFNSTATINIEELFHFATFDIEVWKVEEQFDSLDVECGSDAKRLENWLRRLEISLVDVIHSEEEKTTEDTLEPIKRFVRALSQDTTIICFNYDTLLERVLTQLCGENSWNHGLPNDRQNGVTILKMHGSTDWVMAMKDSLPRDYELLCSPNGDESVLDNPFCYLGRVRDYKLLTSILNGPTRDVQWANARWKPALAGLGAYKQVHKIPGMKYIWSQARNKLKDAEEIIFIGFSLSEFDGMARLHFSGAKEYRRTKGTPQPIIVVIDPSI